MRGKGRLQRLRYRSPDPRSYLTAVDVEPLRPIYLHQWRSLASKLASRSSGTQNYH